MFVPTIYGHTKVPNLTFTWVQEYFTIFSEIFATNLHRMRYFFLLFYRLAGYAIKFFMAYGYNSVFIFWG